ncbi:hypothetical protein SAMN05428962_2731 [Paenibacillus sp. BC26]|nr:hypothetical protein SAMN05428962_2731 [Paenibacillus sp. BC26]
MKKLRMLSIKINNKLIRTQMGKSQVATVKLVVNIIFKLWGLGCNDNRLSIISTDC